jgi:hypothetical protein
MLWVKPFNFLSFFSAEGDLMLLTSDYKARLGNWCGIIRT